jgi:hypothetical protein
VTPAVLDRPGSLFADRSVSEAGRRPVTLEERLSAALHEAHANGSAECPACHARMSYTHADAGCTAECASCGTRLS